MTTTTVKGLSLWQPWASLTACGSKKIETRKRRTHHRGLLVIHAALHWTAAERRCLEAFREAFPAYVPPALRGPKLPLGVLLGTVEVTDCQVMTPQMIRAQLPPELAFGIWEPGRFAYFLANPRPFPEPIPFVGSRGLFNVPASLVPR